MIKTFDIDFIRMIHTTIIVMQKTYKTKSLSYMNAPHSLLSTSDEIL